jgi:glycosyltransferase involved in cell wall biosynthesis
MIKIAFVINTIYGPTGGTESQLLLLIKNLDRSRFSPVLCVMHTSEWLESEFDLCPLYVVGITSYRSFNTIIKFIKFVQLLKAERIDILQALFQDGMRVGIVAGKIAHVPTVIAVRRNQGYWMTNLDCKIFRILNRWVTLFIANSYNTRQWASEFEGIPEEKIQVIHNGLDLKPFSLLQKNTGLRIRNELSIPESARVVGIVANLRPVKAIDVFIRAAQIVKQAIPNSHFVIVGEDNLQGSLQLFAKELGMGDCIHFLGMRTDIHQILNSIDVGVLSSNSESFSNAVVEYLAAALPVVSTDVGGAREAVINNVNGFVVRVGDYHSMAEKLIEIFKYDLVAGMGRESKRIVTEKFSLQTMLDKHQCIYNSCKTL